MYPEYDPNEPSLGQSFADILRGFKNPQAYQQVGQGLVNTAKVIPNVAESLARGGVAQAVGTMGDLRDLRNTVQSYLPQSVQNFSNAAEFMTNPYAKMLAQTAPTTEQTLEAVPRMTAPYEGYKQHETMGEYIAPSLGYFGAKALKAGKDLPIGMTIQDVTPPVEPVKMAEALRQPEKNALGFYSPLDEAVMNLQNQKGTGQQYLAQLLKTQGVKQEEVATRGLDTFLAENPKVTKTQIEEFLAENPVNIKETILGGSQPEPVFKQIEPDLWESNVGTIYKQGDNDYTFIVGGEGEMHYFDNFDEAKNFAKDFAKTDEGAVFADNTKFKDYTLPNGENYKEVLIQYEPKKAPARPVFSVEADTMSASFDTKAEAEAYKAQLQQQYPDADIPITQRNVTANPRYSQTPDYTSGHFAEPNILTHLRTTDRTIDGKKTLFVEEIQSDWHQKGRKQGYQESLLTNAERKRWDELKAKDNKNAITDADRPEFQALAEKVTAETLNARNGVPNAPFKKNWQELAMKRAMQMAAEGGYDRVAFTTGKQQADRYSLSKQINEISYNPETKQLWAYKDGYASPVVSKIVPEEDLPDVIGKEAAKKLLETKLTTYNSDKGDVLHHQLVGQDLDVGGEGMKGFYDKILPDFINKYGKKHGLKVGQTNLKKTGPAKQEQILEKAKELGYTLEQWNAMSYPERSRILVKNPIAGESVHYFDLTPQAKESFLKKGQPMFAVAPAMAITDEDSRRDVLEKLFNSKK
jgi:hypothetical protein